MSLLMIVEVSLRDEGRTAAWLSADVGPKPCVRADVSFEVPFFVEALTAFRIRTHKRLRSSLYLIYIPDHLHGSARG
jgi:hypothetical protein